MVAASADGCPMPAKAPAPHNREIVIRGAKEHNLKNIDLRLPRDKLIVMTGLSGSGKSSLAFDTIYAEGQRRYVESLSAYARQFLEMMQKPDVEQIDGLSPAISIEQKTTSRNPRSTVGTVTEIYDYLRLLFARVGIPYSPVTGLPIESQTVSQMVDKILAQPEGTRLYLLAPIARGRKGEYKRELNDLMRKGFQRVKIDGEFHDIEDAPDPRQEDQARRRSGGRSHRRRPRHRRAPRRELRDGAEAGRRHRLCRVRRREGNEDGTAEAADLFREIRRSDFRLHHSRDRAAAVLVQQPVRRLPGLRRPRHRAEDRPRPDRPRHHAVAARRRHPALVARPARPTTSRRCRR